ncbi:hypothetical protein ACKUB1_13010 [Methanospirillum stamsii]|uniref:DUF3821 domain-containing protein n=1 Tax=Methanospirillum stamsii TaxID=1277351 RepID=A0A2V2N8U2_9EURY|nr:hypothetical protein [Methanospirillum stamsii]PWR76259.1 hypothetical protein DLD82_00145 [Methanospirillum stamsii]
MFFKRIILIVVLIAGIVIGVQANQTISIDPIGNLQIGEKFNITGTTTIENCKKIGVEIFPKKIWDTTSAYAKEDESGRVKFLELSNSADSSQSAGYNLIRYNVDGTKTYQPVNISSDYLLISVPVTKTDDGQMSWSAEISEKVKEVPFAPGTYHVNVYDASHEVVREGVSMPNGWDLIKQKIYPSTTMTNIWDPKNEKDMEYAEFTVRKS